MIKQPERKTERWLQDKKTTKSFKKFKDVLFLYFRISESLLGVECLWVIINVILCLLLSVIYIGQTMDDKKGTVVSHFDEFTAAGILLKRRDLTPIPKKNFYISFWIGPTNKDPFFPTGMGYHLNARGAW